MAVYGYSRVSTAQQADEGQSLGAQQRKIEGYAQMLGLAAVDRMFEERAVSGSIPIRDRPEGAALLEALKPGDVVITTKLDRMFRSAKDALSILEILTERKISLHMIDLGGDVTSNGISKLVFTILSAVAEAERERIRERIRDVKRDGKARGQYLGGVVPFGYRLVAQGTAKKVKMLVPDEAEQAAIEKMRGMRSQDKSFMVISDAMKKDGFSISHVTVKRIMGVQ